MKWNFFKKTKVPWSPRVTPVDLDYIPSDDVRTNPSIFPVYLVDDEGTLSYAVYAEFELCSDGCIRPLKNITWEGLNGKAVAVVAKFGQWFNISSLTVNQIVKPGSTVSIDKSWTIVLGPQDESDRKRHMKGIKQEFIKPFLELMEHHEQSPCN